MENRINIVELLKDCPRGMELDCVMYNKVTLLSVDDKEDNIFPIKILREDGNTILLTKYGQYTYANFAKCIIYPKGKTTWEGFVPPCKFKDGDILATDLGSVFYLNTRLNTDECYGCYAGVGGDGSFHICGPFAYKECCGLATEEEKEKLFKAIKDNGYKWNAETKTLEKLPKFKVGDKITNGKTSITIGYIDDEYYYEVGRNIATRLFIKNQDEWNLIPKRFDITTLKPFDKVLARDNGNSMWIATLFSHLRGMTFYTVGGWYNQCIPYEGNEHLLGKCNDCDEYYKNWTNEEN